MYVAIFILSMLLIYAIFCLYTIQKQVRGLIDDLENMPNKKLSFTLALNTLNGLYSRMPLRWMDD
jgi:hypothetical protein